MEDGLGPCRRSARCRRASGPCPGWRGSRCTDWSCATGRFCTAGTRACRAGSTWSPFTTLYARADLDARCPRPRGRGSRGKIPPVDARQRVVVGVADAGRLDLDQHLAGLGALEIELDNLERLPAAKATAARVFIPLSLPNQKSATRINALEPKSRVTTKRRRLRRRQQIVAETEPDFKTLTRRKCR